MHGLIARIRSRQQMTSVIAIAGGGLLLLLLLTVGSVVPNPFNTSVPPAFGAENPAVGNEDNTNPVFDTVQNWRDLVTAVENEQAEWYKQCLQTRIGVSWDQAQAYAKLVDQGNDLRFILVSNTSVSDVQARQMLKDKGIPSVDNLKVVRVNGFTNTQGLPADKCQAFGDARSQVRIALAVPIDVNDPKKGIHTDKGVLGMCSNPFNIPSGPTPAAPPPTTSPPTTVPTTVPPTTTTTRPCSSGKCTPPTTVAPPPTTTPQPSTTTTLPSGDSGDGAGELPPPPTTVAPTPAPPDTSPPTTNPPPPPP